MLVYFSNLIQFFDVKSDEFEIVTPALFYTTAEEKGGKIISTDA